MKPIIQAMKSNVIVFHLLGLEKISETQLLLSCFTYWFLEAQCVYYYTND